MLRIGQVEPSATADGKYTDGSVAGGIAATRLRAAAFNAMQEELANIVESAGMLLSPDDMTQVLTALKKQLLSRANPFADIKADGPAVVAAALSNLGLGAAAKSGVVQTTGQSEKDVISQKGATDSFALKTLLDNFGGATLLFNKTRNYSLQLSDAGALSLYSQALDKIVMAWSPSGELLTGTVGFEHVKELKSAAKKDVGNGAGQIPDMSFFTLSGMGTDNLIAKLPNGLIIQVFRRTVSNSSTVGVPVVTSANYPTPFPVAVWGVFCTKMTYAQVSVSCESATSTGFDIATVLNTGTGGSTLSRSYFIALGY